MTWKASELHRTSRQSLQKQEGRNAHLDAKILAISLFLTTSTSRSTYTSGSSSSSIFKLKMLGARVLVPTDKLTFLDPELSLNPNSLLFLVIVGDPGGVPPGSRKCGDGIGGRREDWLDALDEKEKRRPSVLARLLPVVPVELVPPPASVGTRRLPLPDGGTQECDKLELLPALFLASDPAKIPFPTLIPLFLPFSSNSVPNSFASAPPLPLRAILDPLDPLPPLKKPETALRTPPLVEGRRLRLGRLGGRHKSFSDEGEGEKKPPDVGVGARRGEVAVDWDRGNDPAPVAVEEGRPTSECDLPTRVEGVLATVAPPSSNPNPTCSSLGLETSCDPSVLLSVLGRPFELCGRRERDRLLGVGEAARDGEDEEEPNPHDMRYEEERWREGREGRLEMGWGEEERGRSKEEAGVVSAEGGATGAGEGVGSFRLNREKVLRRTGRVTLRGPSSVLRVGSLPEGWREENEAPGVGERGAAVESQWGASAAVVLAHSFPFTVAVEVEGRGEAVVAWRGRGGEGRGGEGGRCEDEVDGVGALLVLGLEEKKEVDPRRGEVPKLFARRRNARGPLVLRVVGGGADTRSPPPFAESPAEILPDPIAPPISSLRLAPSAGSTNDSTGLRGMCSTACPHSNSPSRPPCVAISSSPGVGGRLNNPSPACISASADVVRARGGSSWSKVGLVGREPGRELEDD